MSFAWPEFSQPVPLADNRAWSAVYDSYDERNDDCYYEITVTVGGRETARFTARVNIAEVGDGAFVDRLREALSAIAESGQSNTDYTARFGRPIWVAAENWDNKLRQEKAAK